jgi:membrane protein implicated in regulation of membrane protease activity
VRTGTILIVVGAFLTCAVEMVEALTILLSVGVAAGVAVGLALTALLMHEGVNAWWLLPAALAVVLALSLRRAADRG